MTGNRLPDYLEHIGAAAADAIHALLEAARKSNLAAA